MTVLHAIEAIVSADGSVSPTEIVFLETIMAVLK